MKQGDLITSKKLKEGQSEILLDKIYPIGEIIGASNYKYFINDMPSHSNYANRIEFSLKTPTKVEVYLGVGYVAYEQPDWNKRFEHTSGWSGGDGIFTFNLEDGMDRFDQTKTKKTLFIFGDTFVGRSNPETRQRLEPHLMINNSIAYLEDDKLDFHVNTLENGNVTAYYHLDERFDKTGSVPQQLIDDLAKVQFGYVSGYYPKDLELKFDFHKERLFTHVIVQNYFNPQDEKLAHRGMKAIEIYGSNDDVNYELVTKTTLKLNTDGRTEQQVRLKTNARYIKFKPLSNYNQEDFMEGLYGLNKIYFYNDTQHYKDIFASANSTLLENDEHSWIWLQDGAVVGDTLFFYPFIVNSDQNQPEGLQFRIAGISMFTTKIKDGKLDFSTIKQKRAPLLKQVGDTEWMFGAGVFANTKQADALNPDGYIYLYGCKTQMGYRELVVTRVLAENFEYFDDYEFYSDGKWVTEISLATPLLGHISTELSVTEIRQGHYKGKYLCVFTYDVNTPKVSFAIGDTPYGPFSEPQVIYIAPEAELFKSTTYTYNAKAHPHLSNSKDILVTYNTNTYSFEHNMSDYRVYHPRFLKFKDTTKE